ncbi:hypothetical protein GCM10010358_19860 [Streptomyces minutiscleroticus]|uniref:Uncharacterized protein n=1 Tax=Streptomyces minutiscleroticus TaxID=68238 RepID=A0A918KJQ3_9ACTN|nr:hypothetical protein GCM10010358_19860 [Streptomyces minutiscleroticus]
MNGSGRSCTGTNETGTETDAAAPCGCSHPVWTACSPVGTSYQRMKERSSSRRVSRACFALSLSGCSTPRTVQKVISVRNTRTTAPKLLNQYDTTELLMEKMSRHLRLARRSGFVVLGGYGFSNLGS